MIQEDDKIILCSEHTVKLNPDNFYLVNVGSVGQPRDFDSRSCYAIYDSDIDEITLVRVAYDYSVTQKKIIENNLPGFLAERLEKGK
jgi:diadenosine tetraphosphatase ApaH/serine/threonine PP2A family protein phosphatase